MYSCEKINSQEFVPACIGFVPGAYEWRQKCIPKLMPISFYEACISFLKCSGHLALQRGKS